MAFYTKRYDMIVVGAGHAGCEAALAAARMGCRVLLLAIDLDKVAAMPCSPSIGGMAKGQLVREVDALGGEMARITDQTAIQYRMLNTKKGPAVQSSRTQNDKKRYHMAMKAVLERQPGLDLKQALVEKLVVEGQRVVGVEDHTGFGYMAQAVVLATGTFLSGLVHIGFSAIRAGRAGEFAGVFTLPPGDRTAEIFLRDAGQLFDVLEEWGGIQRLSAGIARGAREHKPLACAGAGDVAQITLVT